MDRLQKLVNSAPQGIILTNGRDEITHWNPAAENVFGWSATEVIGSSLVEVIKSQAPELAVRWENRDDVADLPLQGKVVSNSGETHLVEFLFGRSEVDEHGETFRLIIANDITHQWLREEQLQRSVRLRAVMNTVLHVAMLDNPLLQQLQLILDLILAIPSLNILPMGAILIAEGEPQHLSLKVHKGLTAEHVATCGMVPMGNCYCGRAAVEEVVVSEGNCIFPPEWAAAPCRKHYPDAVHYSIPIRAEDRRLGVLVLFFGWRVSVPHSEIETMLAMANVLAAVLEREELRREQDELISHLKSFNKSLRDEKIFSDSIIASLPHGLLVLDNDGKVVACNPAGRRLLGQFFPGGLLGQRLAEIVGENLAEVLLANVTNLSPTGGIRKTLAFTDASGEARIVEYISFPRIDDAGERKGSIISFSDITEADRLLRKMEKMNRFSTIAEIASAVAHEVRNPLAGIKAISQGVESKLEPGDRNRENLRRITNQVDRLNVMLTDFFTYALPPKPLKKPADIKEIVDKVIPLLHSRAQKNSIVIDNRLGENLPRIVVDPNQIQQVILNLLLNAFDAVMQLGRIEIVAEDIDLDRSTLDERRFTGLPADVPYLMVRISDSGKGMPSEIKEKIFEPFFTTKSTGTGLGLAIVMRIIKEHDAHLYVESEMHQGATFFLFFRKD